MDTNFYNHTYGSMRDNTLKEHFNFGHLSLVFVVALFLVGASWLKNPELFNINKNSQILADDPSVPRYYAYISGEEDIALPMVAGASTDPVPSLINEDGSVTPLTDMGLVLGASTEDVQISLDEISVKEIPDSEGAVKAYFINAQEAESGFIDNANFESALSSGNQEEIDKQTGAVSEIKAKLLNIPVPGSLVKLHKLKIAQYESAVGLLKNFTRADENPELVGQYLNQFLKAQQDMDNEQSLINQKYNLTDILTAVNLSAQNPAEEQTSDEFFNDQLTPIENVR